MAGFKVITPPQVEPISLQEAKDHLRIEHDADDSFVLSLIKSARSYAENYTKRAFISQSLRAVFNLKGNSVFIHRPQLISIESVKSVDKMGVETVIDAENYHVDDNADRARLYIHNTSLMADCIIVDYTAGFGANADDVPDDIKVAIKQIMATWYEERESSTRPVVGISALNILDNYRVYSL